MATEKEDSILEISALSRPLHLGTLYNARNHSVVPGRTLWKDDEICQNTILHEQASTKYDVKITESFNDKTELLDLSGSLKASVLVGLVNVKGSAEYLKSQITSNSQCSATLQYHVTTTSKKLKISEMKIHYSEVFKEPEPTHVVIQVLYGADALMEFQYMAKDEAEKTNFQGNLKTMIKKIPIVEVDADGKIKLSPEDKKKVQNLSCKFYGDFMLKENPYTYEEAVKVCKELPSLLGEKKENAVPVKVWLYPLKRLNDVAAKLTNEISESILSEVEKVIDDLHQARIRTSDLIENCKSIKAVDIIHKLERFQTCLRMYIAEFLQKLRKLIPDIRGGTAEESALRDELISLSKSGFSKKEIDAWLSDKLTELEQVKYYIKEMCGIQKCEIKSPGPELEFYLCSATQDVVMFCFTSLNDEELFLRKIEKSSASDSPPVKGNLISHWYRNYTIIAKKALDIFKSQMNCDKIITFITDPDHPGASVRVYHHGKLKYKNLKFQTMTTIDYKLMPLNVSVNEHIKKHLEAITLGLRSAKHLRFLVIGPVGHGKSSFINSVNSVFQGHVCMGALVATQSDRSFTFQYKTHQIKNKERALPFVFSDIMGLENDEGIRMEDIITCLDGHTRDNYTFNVFTALHEGDEMYNKNPSVDDKVHCLVTVVSAEKIKLLPASIMTKMKDIINQANDMGIPMAVVLTHVDKVCLQVRRDLTNISSSTQIQAKMEECRNRLGVDMSCILPMKNYHSETKLDPKVDCLILRAFKELVLCANSYIQCL